MSILSKIKTGRNGRAQKVVIFAPEGFGKSTLASRFPSPLFLDIEDSTSQMDVKRLTREHLPDLETFESALTELCKSDFQTIVVDTIDWLEQMAVEDIVSEAKSDKIKGVEDFGFGKGYVFLKDRMTITLAKLDRCVQAGKNVVLLAHSKVNKFEPPDGVGPFDRYELKLSKHVAPLFKEWADALIFGNWKTQVREKDKHDAGQQFKGVGGKERQMYCNRCAAWDAKNRHGMADVEKWEIETIEKAFRHAGAAWLGEPALGAQSTTKEAPKPAPIEDSDDQIPMAHATDAQNPEDKALYDICNPHANAIQAHLLAQGKIQPGQSYFNVDAAYKARILKFPDRFLTAVKAATKGGI